MAARTCGDYTGDVREARTASPLAQAKPFLPSGKVPAPKKHGCSNSTVAALGPAKHRPAGVNWLRKKRTTTRPP